MLVVNRFRVPDEDDALARDGLANRLVSALEVLAAAPGYVDGAVGRNVDEPRLWVLTTRWADVGSYRRALSAYDVKVSVVPLLSQALDEPSAFEELGADGVAGLNRARPRGLG